MSVYGMIVEWYGGNPILADFLVGGVRNPIGLGYPSTNWVMVAQTYDSGGGSNNHVLYLRGGATDTIYGTSTGNVDINTEPVRIGQAGLQVDVAAAMLYNRAYILSGNHSKLQCTKNTIRSIIFIINGNTITRLRKQEIYDFFSN